MSRQPITISDNEIDIELNNLSTADNFLNDNSELSLSTEQLINPTATERPIQHKAKEQLFEVN